MSDIIPGCRERTNWNVFAQNLLELLDEIESCNSENDVGIHKIRLEQFLHCI